MDLAAGALFALIAACSVYVLAPLFQQEGKERLSWKEAQNILERLYEEKERLYLNLAELDFEHASGKIADDEYESSREEIMREAVSILEKIERIEKGKTISFKGKKPPSKKKGKVKKDIYVDKVEEEIRKFKKRKGRK
jgi:cytochrome c-type biogenesis protein CcmH/NrfG